MLTFTNPKCDVPLLDFFNFDIVKTVNHKSVPPESSLTLGCSFGRQLKPKLFLTKQEHNIENVNTRLMVQNAAKELEKKIETNQRSVTIEHALTYHIEKTQEYLSEDYELATLRNKYSFLRLAPNIKKVDLESCIFELQTKGLTPVLVFPEKADHLSARYFNKLSRRNCFFQCDLLALTGIYGDRVKSTVTFLLKEKLIGFFGLEFKNIEYLKGINKLRVTRKTADLLSKQMLIQI